MAYSKNTKSNLWFLLPILFGLIGGIAAFFILRKSDPHKAKNCLYVGIVFMVIGVILNVFLVDAIPGLDSGFDVNV